MTGAFEQTNVTLEHKTSLKSLGYISQKYIVWVKIIDNMKIFF